MKRRCAIYTRTSTEEGLSQDFNSLHAQAEACAAYIKSQVGEGWSLTSKPYEDGGFSGGSLERPALKRLLADVEAGKIDVIVVYKVDRLTRSLADFAKIVEILDKANASFVSITQSFNTTTSMGRLTLNVLLSFAQFEREVTGERIRDKFAASKAKGMWMGGNLPLGYDLAGRSLVINEHEAERVRLIFNRFIELRSIPALYEDLKAKGIRSKHWTSSKGVIHGDAIFTRGALYALLRNPLYRGLVRHKGKLHPGQHQAIIDAETWSAAEEIKGAPKRRKPARPQHALVSGKLFDDRGNAMSPSHAQKGAVRYRYYVSKAMRRGAQPGSLSRVAMGALDEIVLKEVGPLLARGWMTNDLEELRVKAAILRVQLSAHDVKLELAPLAIDPLRALTEREGRNVFEEGERVVVTCDLSMARPRNTTLLIRSGAPTDEGGRRPDRALIRAVAMAHAWMKQLDAGAPRSITALAKQENLCFIHTSKLLPLAYLAPDLVEMILDGRQPARMTLSNLIDQRLPLEWHAQRELFTSLR